MSFTHTLVYLGNAPASQRLAQALSAVSGLSPSHYAANSNEDVAQPVAFQSPRPDPTVEFAYLYDTFARAEQEFWRHPGITQ